MQVNLKEILTLSHIGGVQRPLWIYNKEGHRIYALDIFFYSENWVAYESVILSPVTPKLTVEINGVSYPIKLGNPGTSPLHPIVWKRDTGPFDLTGTTETLHMISGNSLDRVEINIINNIDADTVMQGWGGELTSDQSKNTGWGGNLTNSDTYDTGWGGVKPDALQYLSDIICVIQPSVYEDKGLSDNLEIESNLTSIFL